MEEILHADLPRCLDTYLDRGPAGSPIRAAGQLVQQLAVVAAAVDRLAAAVRDVHAQRAEELTRELPRRHGAPDRDAP